MYVGKCGNGDPISPPITEVSSSASSRGKGLLEAGYGAAQLSAGRASAMLGGA